MWFFTCSSQNQKPTREPFKLEVAIDAKQYYSMDVTETPYFVKEKVLQIYPGETVLIEAEIQGDSIGSMKVVHKNLNPDRTIEVIFSQNAKDKNNISMMLNVKNPFSKVLKYSALMYTPASTAWKRTSIIPIQPKLQNFESWPHAIITLVLDDWRF